MVLSNTILSVVAKNILPSCFSAVTHYNEAREICKGASCMEIRKVSIRLRSVIDGDETHCEYIGEYRQMEGSHLIAYTDYTGNAVTKVGIEARDNAMLLHRVGSITADMLFEPGAETVVNYEALSLRSRFSLHTYEYHMIQGDEDLGI